METIICLSAKNITILQGEYRPKSRLNTAKLVIHQKLTIPTPEAAVMNGRIMDDKNELLEQLQALKKRIRFKNTVAVIDSDYVKTVVSLLPTANRAAMMNMAKSRLLNEREVSGDDYVYDYCELESDFTAQKQVLVLSCALQKDFVDQYKKLFADAKIKLKRLDVTLSGVLKLTRLFTEFHPTRSIICVVDDLFINIMSFNPNGSLFNSRKRFESAERTSDYYAEVIGEIHDYVHYKAETSKQSGKSDLYIVDANLGDFRYYSRAIADAQLNEDVEYMFIGMAAILKSDGVVNGKTGKPFSPEDMIDLETYYYNIGALL